MPEPEYKEIRAKRAHVLDGLREGCYPSTHMTLERQGEREDPDPTLLVQIEAVIRRMENAETEQALLEAQEAYAELRKRFVRRKE